MKITILIPTKNRAVWLEKCLETCLDQDWTDCGLLISDNVSMDHTKEVVSRFQDRLPITYVNPGQRLGMTEHWEFAIPYATGEYLCIIGDDDGIVPHGLEEMKKLLQLHPLAPAFV